MTIPNTMMALEIDAYQEMLSFKYVKKVIPQLNDNEVLIKIKNAPVNPSDLAFVTGNYGFTKPLPVVPGMEGCGEVIAAGQHEHAQALLGKRVACFAGEGDGTWAEYMIATPYQCIPLLDHVSDKYGAMLMVNPLTALALIEEVKRSPSKAFIQNAAGSALCHMIRKLAAEEGLTPINIVRQRRQAKDMVKSGLPYSLNSSAKDFDEQLKAMCDELQPRVFLDAVGGEATGQILNQMPEASSVVLYGGLSGEKPDVSIEHLIFKDHKVRGFWLAHYLKNTPVEKLMELGQKAQQLMTDDLDIKIQSQPKLEYAAHSIASYAGNMSRGKVLITPHQETQAEGA